MNGHGQLDERLHRVQRIALAIGAAALAACLAGAAVDRRRFFEAYLLAYLFWLGLALGCLVILMIHHLAGGRWGFAVRRLLEAGAGTLPALALLFLPCLLGLRSLYVWTDPAAVAADPLLQHKQPYLNVPFFLARTIGYFAVWLGTRALLARAARQQDETPSRLTTRRLTVVSGAGLALYTVTMSFAGVDWVMSLEPRWYSTIYGVLIMSGQLLTGFAFVTVVGAWLARFPPYADTIGPQQFHDLGNFLLTFTIFWAYIAFSQFLIIWAGNLPEENAWYLRRLAGGWQGVGGVLVALHFFAPFFLLLSRDIKRRAAWLWRVALLIFLMGYVDVFWTVAPGFGRSGLRIGWLDGLAPVGLGGLWLGLFVRGLRGRSLLPVHDSRVEEELEWA